MRRLILVLVFLLSLPSVGMTFESSSEDFYKLEMQRLMQELRFAAHKKNPHFGVIGNGGVNLYNPWAYTEYSEEKAKNAIALVDGVLIESLNYGYDYEDDKKTPGKERAFFIEALTFAKEQGIALFNIDYCTDKRKKNKGEAASREAGFLNFSAKRDLDEVPLVKLNEKAVTSLHDCKNFCALLNPHKFSFKETYLNKLRNSNYDLLIIDGYFGGHFLEAEDVASLKRKPNGQPRLVYCYMSLGEAEDYRWYWNREYETNSPDWLAAENENWDGNYKVKYWLEPWHKIIYGSENSYLSKILAAGFDGVFLDVIDAFEYFEDSENNDE